MRPSGPQYHHVVAGAIQQPGQGQASPFIPLRHYEFWSSVYKISRGRVARGTVEFFHDELVYALGILRRTGNCFWGTGNEGSVLEVEGNRFFSRLVKTTSGQATAIVAGGGGKLFVATGNPGKIYALGPGLEPEGSYESQVFDARTFSHWGHLQWWGHARRAPRRLRKRSNRVFRRDPGNHIRPQLRLESPGPDPTQIRPVT